MRLVNVITALVRSPYACPPPVPTCVSRKLSRIMVFARQKLQQQQKKTVFHFASSRIQKLTVLLYCSVHFAWSRFKMLFAHDGLNRSIKQPNCNLRELYERTNTHTHTPLTEHAHHNLRFYKLDINSIAGVSVTLSLSLFISQIDVWSAASLSPFHF